MRKITLLILCVAFMAGFAFADTDTDPELVYEWHTRNDSGGFQDNLIEVTSKGIRTIDKLKGYDAVSIAGETSGLPSHTATYMVIFDSTDVSMTGERLGEREADSGYRGTISENWARGKKIVNGVHVRVGPYTEGYLYFVKE